MTIATVAETRQRSFPAALKLHGDFAWSPAAVAATALALAATCGALIALFGPRAAVAAPALLAVLVLTAKPHLGLMIVAVTISLEAAWMLPGGVSVARAAGMLMAVAWAAHTLLNRARVDRILTDPLVVIATILVMYAITSTLWGQYDVRAGRLLLLAQLLMLTVITADLGAVPQNLRRVAHAVLLGAFLCAILVILQYARSGVGRAGGDIAGGINASARALVTALPFAFYAVASRKSGFARVLGIAYIPTGIAAILLTFSRASMMLILILLPICFARMLRAGRWYLWAAIPLLSLLAVMRFAPMEPVIERARTIVPYVQSTLSRESGDMSSSRGFHLRVAIAVFLDHPVLGGGYGNYGAHFLDYQWRMAGGHKIWSSRRSSHSSHFGLLADLGLVGALFWVGVWLFCFVYVRNTLRRSRSGYGAGDGLLAEAIGLSLLLHFLYGFTAEVHLEKLLWLLFGAAVAVHGAGHGTAAGPGRPGTQRALVSTS